MANSIKAIQTALGSVKLARFIEARKIIRLNNDKSLEQNMNDLKLSLGARKFQELERRICAEYKIINTKGNIKKWC